jgi:hypothetical protein
MAKRPKTPNAGDPLFLQRILRAVIEAYPIHPDNPRVRLQTAMWALTGDRKSEVPWPAPKAPYYEIAKQLRLQEMREGMAQEIAREDQVGIMSLIPAKTPRARKISKAADRLQEETHLEDLERVFKENLQRQPTRLLAHHLDFQAVLQILSNHRVKFDSRS